MTKPYLIQHATLINEGRMQTADVRLANGRIQTIGQGLTAAAQDTVIDASGLYLMPGVIDNHVHFREPGMTDKGDIWHESRAAVAGGVTSYIDMPNTQPAATTMAAYDEKFVLAAKSSIANYSFYFGAANDNIALVRELDPHTVPGLKIFLCASTGNLFVDDADALADMFRDCPVPVLTHCEDPDLVHANMAAAKKKYGDAVPAREHALIRSREACIRSTRHAIELAKTHGTDLHVLHISTAEEAAMFEVGAIVDKRITGETCPHFMHFCDADYERLQCRIKCNPSIKAATDRQALIQAVAAGRIDIIATDHAPHQLQEKDRPYTQAPSGLPLIQYSLQSVLEHVLSGALSLPRVVEVMCHNPALRFGIENRGFIREGYAADLVLVAPDKPYTVSHDKVLSKCRWSPFAGETFNHSILATFVNGVQVWDGEQIIHPEHRGEQLRFNRSKQRRG